MTSVAATGTNHIAATGSAPTGAATATNNATLSGLPEPTATAASPGDLMGEMLAMMEKTSQLSTSNTEHQLSAKHNELEQARKDFLKKIADAIRKQEHAKQHHGLFGSIFHAVGDALGEALGTLIDFAKDTVIAPVKMTVGLAEGKSLSNVMQSEMHDLLTNGDWANTVKNCTEGVVGFAGDLQDAVDGIATDLASGRSVGEAFERAGKKAWSSLKTNILENKDFWKVTGAIATAVAVAAAVMTGGALAFLAVGLILVCEVDNHTHFINKAFGPKAGPWVKLGMEVAASALSGGAAMASQGTAAMQAIQAASAIASGVSAVGQGVQTIDAAKQKAGEIRAQADVTQALNRMQQIQRMIDDLISVLEEKSDQHKSFVKGAAKLVQTQGAVQAAAIMRA
jgi:hypothetical protein